MQNSDQIEEEIKEILEKFPFLSYGTLQGQSYLGIIQNSDNRFLSMYDLDRIPEEEDRILFLQFGEMWWWDSNRQVPINMFIKDPRFRQYRDCLRHFSRKEFNLLSGHTVSLADTMARRVRKRQVTLVRRLTD